MGREAARSVAIHYRLDQLDRHVARDVVAELGQPLGPRGLRVLLYLAVDERAIDGRIEQDGRGADDKDVVVGSA